MRKISLPMQVGLMAKIFAGLADEIVLETDDQNTVIAPRIKGGKPAEH